MIIISKIFENKRSMTRMTIKDQELIAVTFYQFGIIDKML